MDEKELDKMAEDIEPIEETKEEVVEAPKEEVKPEAPTGFVEDKETYVKSDGETTTTPVHNLIKEESGAKKWVLGGLASILILGLGAATAWLYMDAQNARNELLSVKTGLDTAKSDAAKLRDEVQALKVAPKEPTEEPATTQELADSMVIAHKAAGKGVKFSASTKKISGDFVVITVQDNGPEGAPLKRIYKKVGTELVEIGSYGVGQMLKADAEYIESAYGVDLEALDVPVED